MKSILKEKHIRLPQAENATQSSSIAAVHWTLPEKEVQAHNTAPSKSSNAPRQKDLRDLRSLQECVQFLTQWKEEVEHVCKPGGGAVSGSSNGNKSAAAVQPHSLDQCRNLILQWAEELKTVDRLFGGCEVKEESGPKAEMKSTSDSGVQAEQRIMEWAKELQTVSELCGVMREDLALTLRQMGLKKKKLLLMLPFLEFITWSLIKHDQDMVPQLWLLNKQRTWKTETPKYIPNSVWNWICSASVEVTLDPSTSHPWLQLSDDQLQVQEALREMEVEPSPQRFDNWPCVLGWQAFSSGRYYWEVDIANKGYWRVGVTTASSKRHGRFPMSPCEGYWVIWKSTRQFYACNKPETPLPLALVPRKVGVYLDYEEGQVSFYNAETRSHIHTFMGYFREKLYPLFGPLDGRTLMTLLSPNTSEKL